VILSLLSYTILALVVVGLGLYIGGAFNQMVRSAREIDRAFSNIDVMLKQRHDELPRLVEICRGYMSHEKSVFEQITRLRSEFDKAKDVDSKVTTQNRLEQAVTRTRALAEAYPELMSNEHFRHVENRLTTLENQIADRREFFNASVTTYNTFIESFPALLLARTMGFRHRPVLELGVGSKPDLAPLTP
jgi:LemA protein